MGKQADIWLGTLQLMILRSLETLGPLHGYGLARRIEQTSEQQLLVNVGTIYPALLRLEQEGYVSSYWAPSENGRRAKYYELTKAGKKRLHKVTREWELTTQILSRFLSPKAAKS